MTSCPSTGNNRSLSIPSTRDVAVTRAKRELDLTLCPQALGVVPPKKAAAQLPAPAADKDPDEGLTALEITAKLWS